MEVTGFVQEMLQNVAEHAASYRLGQSVLRQIDRVLWTIEKSARWAVPPPLDQDEHPQPELIRPLPWVFFLTLLVALRVIRESISLVNLVLGKPPLRSADVVTYIQGKRRYLRTLKYQGNRMMRARSKPAQPSQSWFSSVQSLFEFTMCFRRHPQNYGNNNTTRISNNDEVLSANPMSVKSDRSEDGADSEQETIPNDILPNESHLPGPQLDDNCQVITSTPEKNKFNHFQQYDKGNEERNSQSNEHSLNTKGINQLVVKDNDKTRLESTPIVDLHQTNADATSTLDETKLLLKSEINFTQNNKPQHASKHILGVTK